MVLYIFLLYIMLFKIILKKGDRNYPIVSLPIGTQAIRIAISQYFVCQVSGLLGSTNYKRQCRYMYMRYRMHLYQSNNYDEQIVSTV